MEYSNENQCIGRYAPTDYGSWQSMNAGAEELNVFTGVGFSGDRDQTQDVNQLSMNETISFNF